MLTRACAPPIRDYAVIGDGRTVALIARDASIDWLCLPNLDSGSVFAALLDTERGGRFELAPAVPHEAARRYLPGTNVLETTFRTDAGAVRVTDAMTVPDARLGPFRELARRVEGVAGRVPMRWRIEPRFDYARATVRIEARRPFPVALSHGDAIGICAWGAGEPQCDAGAISGACEIREGDRALLALVAAHGEPLVFPPRADVESRLDETTRFWRQWSGRLAYEGAWRDAVGRSALTLKLLVFAPSGAIAAAPTTSLPEAIGGDRNWDYRYSWLRDSSFTLEALLQLGCHAEATSFFWWFMHATRLKHPRLQPFYRLDGGASAPERTLPLAGYRGSAPVRMGNGAADQLQLDTYGNLLDTALGYANRGFEIDQDTAKDLADLADFICTIWRQPDRGIWEVRMAPRHFTHSKAMCWVALDRAIRLADMTVLPGQHLNRWRAEAAHIRSFIDEHCWSERKQTYVRFAGTDEVDASLLMMAIMRYAEPRDPRIIGTIDAVRRELGHGPLVYRYLGEDGLARGEGVFLCCSFWLVEALALAGRQTEAVELMNALLALANDVGLYAEEMSADTQEFLGNFPQGLVHLALISAAVAFSESTA
jgi:GH15 family glucan-1,4-alpha-glucosidase